jgi:hypothetical protein
MGKPSVDLGEFIARSRPTRLQCSVGVLVSQLDDEQRERFTAAVGHPGITATAISSVLADWGHDLPARILQRHRRGDCTCPQS